jgi:hypothetical protein
MSAEDPFAGSAPGGPGGGAQPSEEELRAAYEAELSRITAIDMMAQATVSLLNIGARRLGPPPGADASPADVAARDLEQAGDAIDGARALLAILERRIPRELGPLREALSQLQMAYAREAQAAGTSASPPSAAQPAPAAAGEGRAPDDAETTAKQQPAHEQQPGDGPGPAESSGRLWVPGR